MSSRWRTNILEQFANLWFKILYKKNWHFSEYSQWWYMVHHFTDKLPGVLEEFTAGDYAFSPMEKMRLPKDTLILWAYWDRLIVHLIHKAKKKMHHVLKQLKLKLSPHKTKMGRLTNFHFLGVDYTVSQNTVEKTHVEVTMNKRSCYRARDKVKAMELDSVHPDIIQRYLCRWSSWWRRALPNSCAELLLLFCRVIALDHPSMMRYAVSILSRWRISLLQFGL